MQRFVNHESHLLWFNLSNFFTHFQDTIPLPGFLQTFGQTEIGKFSEAFCSSSDSPFYNSIESDLDSPHMWEHDSLEGPVQMTTSFQICAADVNYDSSPLNNFGELICNEC